MRRGPAPGCGLATAPCGKATRARLGSTLLLAWEVEPRCPPCKSTLQSCDRLSPGGSMGYTATQVGLARATWCSPGTGSVCHQQRLQASIR
jgi:hypothetical protein